MMIRTFSRIRLPATSAMRPRGGGEGHGDYRRGFPRRHDAEEYAQQIRDTCVDSTFERQAPLDFPYHPEKGEFGYVTWEKGSAEYTGNTGVWTQITVDEQPGLVYLPVESPTSDFYGGHRPGNNFIRRDAGLCGFENR